MRFSIKNSLVVCLTTPKLSTLPGRGSKTAIARSPLVDCGIIGATALHMNSLFGMSIHWKLSEMKGLGSALWNVIAAWLESSPVLIGGESWSNGLHCGGRLGFSCWDFLGTVECEEARERRRGSFRVLTLLFSLSRTVLGSVSHTTFTAGALPLAAQAVLGKSAHAKSVNELNTGGLDEDGPAAATLNQPLGGRIAAKFLLLSGPYLPLTAFKFQQFTVTCPR